MPQYLWHRTILTSSRPARNRHFPNDPPARGLHGCDGVVQQVDLGAARPIRENARRARLAGDERAAAYWDGQEKRFKAVLHRANRGALEYVQQWAGITRTGYHGALGFAPRRAGPGSARQGGDKHGHCLDYVPGISQPPFDVLTHNVRPHVARSADSVRPYGGSWS